MKAITYDRYGDPEVLTLTDLPEPSVADAFGLSQAGHASGKIVIQVSR